MAETNAFSGPNAAKRLARMVAIQALYRASFEEETLSDILKSMAAESPQRDDEEDTASCPDLKPDAELLNSIVMGVQKHREELETMLKGALDARFGFDRMEIILRSILSAGAFELLHHQDTPAKVIINDYVDVAHGFFDSKEPGLVNAVLDKLAQKLRG